MHIILVNDKPMILDYSTSNPSENDFIYELITFRMINENVILSHLREKGRSDKIGNIKIPYLYLDSLFSEKLVLKNLSNCHTNIPLPFRSDILDIFPVEKIISNMSHIDNGNTVTFTFTIPETNQKIKKDYSTPELLRVVKDIPLVMTPNKSYNNYFHLGFDKNCLLLDGKLAPFDIKIIGEIAFPIQKKEIDIYELSKPPIISLIVDNQDAGLIIPIIEKDINDSNHAVKTAIDIGTTTTTVSYEEDGKIIHDFSMPSMVLPLFEEEHMLTEVFYSLFFKHPKKVSNQIQTQFLPLKDGESDPFLGGRLIKEEILNISSLQYNEQINLIQENSKWRNFKGVKKGTYHMIINNLLHDHIVYLKSKGIRTNLSLNIGYPQAMIKAQIDDIKSSALESVKYFNSISKKTGFTFNEDIKLTSEAVASFKAYHERGLLSMSESPNHVVISIDVGGGTIDVCVGQGKSIYATFSIQGLAGNLIARYVRDTRDTLERILATTKMSQITKGFLLEKVKEKPFLVFNTIIKNNIGDIAGCLNRTDDDTLKNLKKFTSFVFEGLFYFLGIFLSTMNLSVEETTISIVMGGNGSSFTKFISNEPEEILENSLIKSFRFPMGKNNINIKIVPDGTAVAQGLLVDDHIHLDERTIVEFSQDKNLNIIGEEGYSLSDGPLSVADNFPLNGSVSIANTYPLLSAFLKDKEKNLHLNDKEKLSLSTHMTQKINLMQKGQEAPQPLFLEALKWVIHNKFKISTNN